MPRSHKLACGSSRSIRLSTRTVFLAPIVSFLNVAVWANEPYVVKDINPAPGIDGILVVYTVVNVVNRKFLVRADAR